MKKLRLPVQREIGGLDPVGKPFCERHPIWFSLMVAPLMLGFVLWMVRGGIISWFIK